MRRRRRFPVHTKHWLVEELTDALAIERAWLPPAVAKKVMHHLEQNYKKATASNVPQTFEKMI
jgi:hypothetical protein